MDERPSTIDFDAISERLGKVRPGSMRELFVQCVAGDVAPNVALSRLLLAAGRVEDAEELIATAARSWGQPLDPSLRELALLLHDNREGCQRVALMLREHPDPTEPSDSAEEAVELYRDFFDRAVTWSEEGSVAAYSLGNPGLLAEVTEEVADAFESWGLLGPDRRTLEIGCGIGRMQKAIASRVAEAYGIDVSPKMIAAAQRRCAGLANVRLETTPGRDLAQFGDGFFDLVFAVDSFPYIHHAGPEMVATHFNQAPRALRPRAEARRLCHAAGFSLVVSGSEPFKLWDGVVFRCRRS
jgi:ubiquinone/menaquinone biosynthesis C-methylase UbiE